MKKVNFVLLFLCAAPALVGCSSSNEAKPAENAKQIGVAKSEYCSCGGWYFTMCVLSARAC